MSSRFCRGSNGSTEVLSGTYTSGTTNKMEDYLQAGDLESQA